MATDTRAAGLVGQIWPNANPIDLSTQMALAETERALLAQQQAAAQQRAIGVPAVNREAPIGSNVYNMPGSREAWEQYGIPPVMVQSDPYARIAYRQNPNGSVTPLIGFGSVYPHVVRGVADPSLPASVGMWHWLGQQARQANPYGALAAQVLRTPRRTGGGGGGGQQAPAKPNATEQKQQPAQATPAATGQPAPARRGLKLSGQDDPFAGIPPTVPPSTGAPPLAPAHSPFAAQPRWMAPTTVGHHGVPGLLPAPQPQDAPAVPGVEPVPQQVGAVPGVQLLQPDEIEADPDVVGNTLDAVSSAYGMARRLAGNPMAQVMAAAANDPNTVRSLAKRMMEAQLIKNNVDQQIFNTVASTPSAILNFLRQAGQAAQAQQQAAGAMGSMMLAPKVVPTPAGVMVLP